MEKLTKLEKTHIIVLDETRIVLLLIMVVNILKN
jgi:hypothetical protein